MGQNYKYNGISNHYGYHEILHFASINFLKYTKKEFFVIINSREWPKKIIRIQITKRKSKALPKEG